MQPESARVLVIDDDEVVLVAVSDLLEERGYRVYTQGSPIGATQVIVHERIDIVVIDVNLPEMQGDSVVRLLRSWDRFNDLPIVMLSGAETARLEQIQRELPGIQIVRKTAMHRELVKTLEAALAPTRDARNQRNNASGGRGAAAGKSGRDIHQSFLDELALAMRTARTVCFQIQNRQHGGVGDLIRSLDAVRSRARLLDLEPIAQLLAALAAALSAIKPGTTFSKRAQRAVDDAVNTLTALPASRTQELKVSPTFLIRDLEEIASELKGGGG